jgi:antitoxin VapB
VALNIKDPHTDRLARELAALTGEPITVAVRAAIEERLLVLRRRDAVPKGLDLGDIIVRGRERRVLDQRPEAEILGYGSAGLPE